MQRYLLKELYVVLEQEQIQQQDKKIKNKQTLFESFVSFNHCLNEIDNSQLDNEKYSK